MSKPEFSDEFDFENRILDTSEIPEDNIEGDNPLRPKTLSEYIGQETAKENLKVFIEAGPAHSRRTRRCRRRHGRNGRRPRACRRPTAPRRPR